MSVLLRRLAYLFRRRRAERELAEELQFHREMAQRDLHRSGVPEDEAVRAVSRAMGNTTLAREDARARVDLAMAREPLAGRSTRRQKPSPQSRPGSDQRACRWGLASASTPSSIWARTRSIDTNRRWPTPIGWWVSSQGTPTSFRIPTIRICLRSGIFADALGFRSTWLNLGWRDGVMPVSVLAVTANFFDVLGVRRKWAARSRRRRRQRSENRAWWSSPTRSGRAACGPIRGAIGETLILNGQSFTVVGVLPENYRAVTGWVGPQVYVPLSRLILPTIDERGSPSLSVMARLAPDATAAQAQLAVTALGASLERAYPERNEGMGRPASVFPAEAMQFRGTPGSVLSGRRRCCGPVSVSYSSSPASTSRDC